MTSYGEPRVWLQEFPHGQPVAFQCDHLGLQYNGEVIRADRWSPAWGNPLAGETHFRIVLLRQRRGAAVPAVSDPRIALCLPASGLARRRNRLSQEMSTIRETQAVYLTQRDAESELIRTTLQRRQESVEQQLLGQDAVRYSGGQVITASGATPDPATIFAGLDPFAWFSRLGGWLLSIAYPTLPIDGSLLPRPVTAEDAGRLHAAIFSQPGASRDVLAQLGPGLGLSLTDSPGDGPGALDFSTCPVASLIRNRLNELPAPAQWSDLHRYLSHEIGLTVPLASLYLMLYVCSEGPELELRLEPRHELNLLGGRRLPGTLLSRELVPLVIWNSDIGHWATTMGPASQPQWNDALVYLGAINPDLTTVADDEDFKAQEHSLLNSVSTLSQELRLVTGFLDVFTAGVQPTNEAEHSASLVRLSEISGDDFVSVYHTARRIYPDFRRMESDLATLRQLSQLAQWEEDILKALDYLGKAEVPVDMAELSIQRQALQEAMSPAPLAQSSRGWEAMAPQISRFKSGYAAAYRSHHQGIQQSLPSYLRDLESAKRKIAAHTLLNTLVELGEPTGLGLSETVEQMDHGPVSCLVAANGLDLESGTECRSCHLSLTHSLPREELTRLLSVIDGVLGEKNRRLSSLLVERILRGESDQRMVEFLNIVQASDLSALSDTLNEELLDFIRGLLV